ncbi:hypothetical protein JB92DRAFT_144356 [Gautieria morchelliformis]|nr:hypothetical protein JB92DRAFT_144356 [Gautieria morchelliformis]
MAAGFISEGQNAAVSAAAALSLVVFDILLTLDVEIARVWKAPWSATKVGYLICRYLAGLNLVLTFWVYSSNLSCHGSCNGWKWYFFIVIVGSALASSNFLLALRLDNLFRNTKHFRLLMIILYTCEILAQAIILCLLAALSPAAQPSGPSSWLGCVFLIPTAHSLSSIPSSPELGLTCIYFGLAFYKFLRHLRERSNMIGHRAIRESGNVISVFTLLLRDGVLFYTMILATVVITGALFTTQKHALAGLPWLVACYSIAGSRIVLTLHGNPQDPLGIYRKGTEMRVDPSRRTLNTIQVEALSDGELGVVYSDAVRMTELL